MILMTQGTRDEGYSRAERKREWAMKRHIRRFSEEGKTNPQVKSRRTREKSSAENKNGVAQGGVSPP